MMSKSLYVCIFEQVPNFEMPSGHYVKRYNFETITEMLNEIKNRHLEMIERARESRIQLVKKV